MSNMYEGAKTWNPAVGCLFDCIYCRPSFQAQMKRQKHNCMQCYKYVPHKHPDRLNKIPKSPIVFVCGDGDISFCEPQYVQYIINVVTQYTPNQTVYFQSKNPAYFELYGFKFPDNVVLVTTLETNRNEGYENFSQAPRPTTRAAAFKKLPHPRKIITIEPIMKFDLEPFVKMIKDIRPEAVWLGYNSRPKRVQLPEPSHDETRALMDRLSKFTTVRLKTMR